MDDQTLQMFEKVYEQQKRMSAMFEQLHQLVQLLNDKVKLQQLEIELLEQAAGVREAAKTLLRNQGV